MKQSERFVRILDTVWNAENSRVAMRLFAEDATVSLTPPLPGLPEQFQGGIQIQQFVDAFLPAYHAFSWHICQQGEQIRWNACLSNASLYQLGIERAEAVGQVLLRDGKIQSFSLVFDPDTGEKLQAASTLAFA